MKNFGIFHYIALFAIYFTYNISGSFINVYPKLKNFPIPHDADAGDPLFLTPLIESGKIVDARKKAAVQYKEMQGISSYSGYLTVNKEYESNMFFWFFPSQVIFPFFLIQINTPIS